MGERIANPEIQPRLFKPKQKLNAIRQEFFKNLMKTIPQLIIGCYWNAVYNFHGKEDHDVHLTGHLKSRMSCDKCALHYHSCFVCLFYPFIMCSYMPSMSALRDLSLYYVLGSQDPKLKWSWSIPLRNALSVGRNRYYMNHYDKLQYVPQWRYILNKRGLRLCTFGESRVDLPRR